MQLSCECFDREAALGYPDLAGQRARLASLIGGLADREPLRVVHRTFSMLDIVIDNDGLIDVARLNKQPFARMPEPLVTEPRSPATGAPIVDAASRFITRGGSWPRRSGPASSSNGFIPSARKGDVRGAVHPAGKQSSSSAASEAATGICQGLSERK